ncbi:MAG TPA: prepilin-type N-terminal cleavage/methylation domain-containing protein [Candidatus Paceibacterota bacterium]|jgi:prepilin-type N-terminal cleavage/methylation domain-containing protein|nr:prepilin-type N-terminal cleavage/methylation domain-containing protein [Candidatus Paceibacterota bacterium]
MNTQHTQKGFTLVETLVAIAILMVAIAGPLTVANKALTAALGSRNAMIATYLAQDGMESIKNIKDNNASVTGTPWLKGLNYSSCTSKNNPCTTPDVPSYYSSGLENANVMQCDITSTCQLSVNAAINYYYPIVSGTPNGSYHASPFMRYFYFTPVGDGSTETIVTVIVQWTDGSIPNEIRLQELMTNTTR